MILKCVSDYSSGYGTYQKGQITDDLPEDLAALLLRDSPGSFEEVSPKESEAEAAIAAVSDESTSDTEAPNRRVRGGRKRG